MKRYIILALAIISINSFGQTQNDYIEYYNLTNEGDKQIYLKNYKLAYDYYLKAFKKVDYIHSDKLIKAAVLAIKQKDYENAYKFSKNAIILGVKYKFYKKKEFKKFRKTDYYKTFIDSLNFFHNQYLNNLNLDYKKQIDSLFYIDQRIIRKNRSIKGKYNIDKTILSKNLIDLDSLIFSDFLALIKKYGFPTEKNIGVESFNNVWVIYHHNIRLPKNEKYIELAQQALKEGAYLPNDYAWMFDQSKELKKEKPYFYYGISIIHDNLDKELINKRRKEWGIKPLEAQEIKRHGKSIIMKQLW